MPSVLPTIEKTWQKSLNNYAGTQGTLQSDMRQLWRAIKNQLLGFGTLPWTTHYSCNATTAGTAGDNTDRWTADTSLTWSYLSSGAARSWYVFKNANIASNFQMLWSLELNQNSNQGTFERYFYMSVSPSAGFTGGTTTVRPSATDEVPVLNITNGGSFTWNGNLTTTQAYRWNMWHSTDGTATHFMILWNNFVLLRFQLGLLKNATSGWTAPNFWASCPHQNTNSTANIHDANRNADVFNGAWGATRINGVNVINGNYTSEGSTAAQMNALQTFPNDVDLTFKFAPMGVFSPSTAGTRGHHGIVYDIWQGMGVTPTGACYPSDGTRQFVQFGAEVYPWDGSIPLTS